MVLWLVLRWTGKERRKGRSSRQPHNSPNQACILSFSLGDILTIFRYPLIL